MHRCTFYQGFAGDYPMTTEPIHILSLGAGVQSSTMALMASEGLILPMPSGGIFADTGDEPKSVYNWLEWLIPKLVFPVFKVSKGRLSEHALRVRIRKDGKGSWVPSGVPHYSINSDGSLGHGPRQCTSDFKLIPIQKQQRSMVLDRMPEWRRKHKTALKEISVHEKALAIWKRVKKLGQNPGQLPPRPNSAWEECQADALVIAWIGISIDEASRVKPSRDPYIRNRYPLIELGHSRRSCLLWMKLQGFPEPPRSACVFCPYKSDDEWIRLRDEEPAEFAKACAFDHAYRAAKILTVSKKGFMPFIHDSRKPLDQVVFDPSTPDRQINLFNNECEGMCGV
jgi:hypothetical protein